MLKTIIQSVGVSLLSVVIGFLLSILLARFLGPEARGIYGSILTVAILVAGFSQLGLAQGYIYQKRTLAKSGKALLFKSGLLVLLVAVGLLVITQQYFLSAQLVDYFYLIVILALVNSFHQYFQNASHIDERLSIYNALKVLLPLITIIAISAFYFFSDQLLVNTAVLILVFSTLISGVALAAFLFIKEKIASGLPQLTLLDIAPYSTKIYGTAAIGIAINSLDKIALLSLGTMVEFGLYSVAFGLSRLISIVPETLSTVVYSRFAGQDESLLSRVVKQMFAGLFLPLILLCMLLAVIANYLIVFLFGNEYQQAALPFIILLFEAVISSLGWLLAQRFNAAGRPGLVFLRQAISTIPLLVIFIYSFEADLLVLVSSALLVSAIIRLLMTLFIYKRVFSESPPRFYLSWQELHSLIDMVKLKKVKG